MDRRHFLRSALGATALVAAPARLVFADCETRTPPNIEGPFYEPGAPFRHALTEAIGPPELVIRGTVRDTSCQPLSDAVIEVWQADADGEYDRGGNRFRGQLRTTDRGGYLIETVRPGRYLNGPTYRPAHIHMKVHANGRPPLTTQLYFPYDPYNDADPWFRSDLVLRHVPRGCTYPSPPTPMWFDFVV